MLKFFINFFSYGNALENVNKNGNLFFSSSPP